MLRPRPTPVVHFTRVEHLADIVDCGLLPDNDAQARGLLRHEVGNVGIKERRRRRAVPVPPGGHVADYVPFYFAPRSPMMYAIHYGNVSTYQDGCGRLVYLVTTLERLAEHGLSVLLTDRNAVLGFADFINFADGVEDGFIDWNLMKARYWNNTPQEPDRMERRMAECLVRPYVPWEVFETVVVASDPVAREALDVISESDASTQVVVRPEWYF